MTITKQIAQFCHREKALVWMSRCSRGQLDLFLESLRILDRYVDKPDVFGALRQVAGLHANALKDTNLTVAGVLQPLAVVLVYADAVWHMGLFEDENEDVWPSHPDVQQKAVHLLHRAGVLL